MKLTIITAFSLIFLFNISVFAQTNIKITAIFESGKPFVLQEAGKNHTEFKIKLNVQQYKDFKVTANKFAKSAETIISETADSHQNYTCSITSQPSGNTMKDKNLILKMLSDFRVEQFFFDGVPYNMAEFKTKVQQ